jgi:poly(A) polymerase
MLKLLAAADPAPSVAAMQASGVLMRILPGAEADKLAVLVHLEQEAGIAPFSLRRLAVLGEVQADTALRLSNAQIKTLKILRDGIGDMHPLPEIAYRHGAETARDLAVLRAAMFETPVVMDQAAWIQAEAAQFPLTGRDLMPDLTGPALGKRLKELESDWIASGFALSRAQLLARR